MREARAAARRRAERAIILTARGAEQHAKGTDTVGAFINLALALGLPGRPGSGYGCLTGQGNGQGGREHGQKADQLPGYRRIDDPAARAHVAAVWGVDPDDLPGPGRSAYELLDASGRTGAAGAAAVRLQPGGVRAARRARGGAAAARWTCWWSADFVLSETARAAPTWCCPTAQWAEEDGHDDQPGGPGAAAPPGRPAAAGRPHRPGGARRAGRAAGRAGAGSAPTRRRSSTSCARASAGGPADYSGITYERIDAEDGVFWPCPDAGRIRARPGSFLDRFPTPDGRARFVPVEHRPAPTRTRTTPTRSTLTTGRVLAQYQSGAQTRRVAALAGAAPEAFVELHPDLAARLGVDDGEPVRVGSRRGAVARRARLTDADPAGHRLHPVPLGRGRAGPTCSPTPPWTRSRGCRSSRSAPSAWSRPGPTPAPGRVAIRREGLLTRR